MKVDITMPKMGESITEGTLIKWHKNKGDKVEKDEIIFEISTDKVDTEIPSPESGTLIDIKVFENDTVEVDTLVAILDTDGDVSIEKESPKEEQVLEEDTVDSTTQVGGELIDIAMPKMGESVMEGTIIKWHKQVGDKIERDEIIFEISTDKVDTEVPSPVAGTLAEIIHQENDTVDVDVVVAKISTSGGIVKSKPAVKEEKVEKEIEPVLSHEVEVSVKDKPEKSGGRFYSPLVMNIAEKENVRFDELESIIGSGVNGRVQKKDILTYIENRKTIKTGSTSKPVSKAPSAPDIKFEAPKFEEGEGIQLIPMDNIRKRIMYHMSNSRDTSVHVTAVVEVDMSKIHKFIQSAKTQFQKEAGVKLTYMSFISYACIKALQEYPYLNASIDGDNIVLKKFINLGIAVAVDPNGLIVPNIKHADEKNIKGLAKAITELSHKSRHKGLMPDDIMDGTFTITNYGVFGSLFGTPIINQPEVGILGVGTVTKKPVVVEVDGSDSLVIKPMMYLSLSHDHRLVDGMLGGMFLQSIKNTLENFDTSIV
jgi:pyruvate dehydrogenase E2 component (dihydrolipoamide acetyltransferase)